MYIYRESRGGKEVQNPTRLRCLRRNNTLRGQLRENEAIHIREAIWPVDGLTIPIQCAPIAGCLWAAWNSTGPTCIYQGDLSWLGLESSGPLFCSSISVSLTMSCLLQSPQFSSTLHMLHLRASQLNSKRLLPSSHKVPVHD